MDDEKKAFHTLSSLSLRRIAVHSFLVL